MSRDPKKEPTAELAFLRFPSPAPPRPLRSTFGLIGVSDRGEVAPLAFRRGGTGIGWTTASPLSIFRGSSAAVPRPAADVLSASPAEYGGGLGLVALLVFKTSVAPNPC